MNPNKLCFITVMLLILLTFGATAQKKKSQPVKKTVQRVAATKRVEPVATTTISDPALDEKKLRDMMTFLEFMLNTLGSSGTSARDKDVLITESYSKIFRDAQVQIEDDLDENRSVITNKDVVAYLKDINFFFKEAKFEFTIDKIERGVNSGHQTFYKVILSRNLSGTTADGKTVNNISPRYVEVNFDAKKQDLKIASIYTHEFDEKEALRNWWKQLSLEWQSTFTKKIGIIDSVTINEIQKIISISELNLSKNTLIQNFEPLAHLKNLKTLNLSSTIINDLSPIRNLTELTELNLSNTAIRDLLPLKYSSGLMKLNISNTQVSDIGVIQRMPKLQSLDLSNTKITDFSPLASLTELITLNLRATSFSDLTLVESMNQLTELTISRTEVQNLNSIRGLKNLKKLICDSTRIQNISALADLENLKVLQCNATLISDLESLQNLSHLEKIYCDQTLIKKSTAEAFMTTHPRVTIVYDSHNIKSWWDALSEQWREVISKTAKISSNPSDEELTKVGNVDSINFSGNQYITDLTPLSKFQKLRVIIANKTGIQDLLPIREHKEIRYLDISETQVTDLSIVSHFTKLRVLKADQSKIQSIDPLQRTTSLQKLYVDGTTVNDINALEFLEVNPKCLLVYKTIHLNRWWKNLTENWKEIFLAQAADTTKESLHKLVEQEAFHFKDILVTDLSGLSEFMRLKELHFSGTSIANIAPIENIRNLKSLHATSSPIQNIESIGQLTALEDLDISNTPLEDLTPVWSLPKLKTLNCSGTQIKRLNALEKLESLEILDCSNTNVGKLTPLDYLHLKSLKCYNTRVSNRTIENFIASHPKCKVVYYR